MVTCFGPCGCSCDQSFDAFHHLTASELLSPPTLTEMLEATVGWYHDQNPFSQENDLGAWEVLEMRLQNTSGIYVLWNQAGFCSEHQLEHMQATYVGKAGSNVTSRLLRHRVEMTVSDLQVVSFGNGDEFQFSLATYVSVWRCSNRMAKYLEQALLDLYDFPLNASENGGTTRLCHHVRPGAWN